MTAGVTTGKRFVLNRALIPRITAGVMLGFTEVVFCVSIASLIFSGPLAASLPRGVAITLVATMVHVLLITWVSSSKDIIGALEDGTAVLVAVGAAALAGTLGTSGQVVATVIGFIAAATLLTGVFLLLLGYFRLGELVRYIPYPVIGGFMAGSGWLLVQGSIGSMSNYPLEIATLPQLLTPDQLLLWLPGVVFGFVLFFGVRRARHYFTLPGILLGGVIVFFAGLLLTGTSIEAAAQRGLLVGQVGGAVWQPLPVGDLLAADWGAVIGQAGTLGAILLIAAVQMLLNISSLELELRQDLDLNRELRMAGVGNLLSALAGGTIGFHSLSSTLMSTRMGARGRLASLIVAAMCGAALLGGGIFLAYVPKPLLGGLLVYLGLEFLDEWLIQGRRKLGRADYAVVLLILLIIAIWGFLIGVAVGLVVMVVLFVVNYSRLNLFHRATSGAEVASHVERSLHHRRALARLGEQIYVLELQGFLFFGTAYKVLEQVRERLNTPGQDFRSSSPPARLSRSQPSPLHGRGGEILKRPSITGVRSESPTGEQALLFLVLDFRRVTGLDSSAAFSLTKVKYLAEAHDFTLVFTHLSEYARRELLRNELAESEQVRLFDDLDHGMEWCEDVLLKSHQVTKKHVPATLELQLAESGFERAYTARLKGYLEQRLLNEGDYLVRQGDAAVDMFFIEIGRVSVYMELDGEKRVRVRTLGKGSVVGELGFYLDVQRSASVIADSKALAYRLTRPAMEAMKAQDHELAMAFNDLMVRMVSERLISTNREVAVLNL